jgi:hypothetical protein
MANRIREVWAENLDEEMGYLRDTLERYPYVAMVSYTFLLLAWVPSLLNFVV